MAADTKDDVGVGVLSATLIGNDIVFDLAVAKLTDGDGYFAETKKFSNKERVITSDRVVIERVLVSRPGGSYQGEVGFDLLPGTPMRFSLKFIGETPSVPFVVRRMEFTGCLTRQHDTPRVYAFDGIVVSE